MAVTFWVEAMEVKESMNYEGRAMKIGDKMMKILRWL